MEVSRLSTPRERNPSAGIPNYDAVGNTYASSPSLGALESSSTFKIATWIALGASSTSNNEITMPTGFGSAYTAASVTEISGLNATSALDAVSVSGGEAASGASVTSAAFNTANTAEIVLCPTRNRELSNMSWASTIGGRTGTQVSGGTAASPDNFETMFFCTFSTTQSSITGEAQSSPNGVRAIRCLGMHQ